MTDQEAFEKVINGYDKVSRREFNLAEDIWHAALAWLRSQREPVAVTTQSNIAAMAPRETDVPLYTAPVINEGYTRQSSAQTRGFTDEEVRAAFNKVRESTHQLGETIAEWESKFGA